MKIRESAKKDGRIINRYPQQMPIILFNRVSWLLFGMDILPENTYNQTYAMFFLLYLFFLLLWQEHNFRSTLLTNFQVHSTGLLSMDALLYSRTLELFPSHATETLYPLTTSLLPPPPPAPDHHHSTLHFYEFDSSRCLI